MNIETLQQAVDHIINNVADKNLDDFKNAKSFALMQHFGLGMRIRNEFKLWDNKTPLHKFMKKELKIKHPDEMSHKILMEVYNKIKSEQENEK